MQFNLNSAFHGTHGRFTKGKVDKQTNNQTKQPGECVKGLIGEWEEFMVDVELDRKPVEVEVDEGDVLDEKLQNPQALYIFFYQSTDTWKFNRMLLNKFSRICPWSGSVVQEVVH